MLWKQRGPERSVEPDRDLSGLNGAQPSNPQAKIILGTFTNGQEHLLLGMSSRLYVITYHVPYDWTRSYRHCTRFGLQHP